MSKAAEAEIQRLYFSSAGILRKVEPDRGLAKRKQRHLYHMQKRHASDPITYKYVAARFVIVLHSFTLIFSMGNYALVRLLVNDTYQPKTFETFNLLWHILNTKRKKYKRKY